jgi:hypothetical protein
MSKLFIKYVPYTPLILVLLAYAACFCLLTQEQSLTKKDCMIAEISPDFSAKEKEMCKSLRKKQ